jgi:hypothetical protein
VTIFPEATVSGAGADTRGMAWALPAINPLTVIAAAMIKFFMSVTLLKR